MNSVHILLEIDWNRWDTNISGDGVRSLYRRRTLKRYTHANRVVIHLHRSRQMRKTTYSFAMNNCNQTSGIKPYEWPPNTKRGRGRGRRGNGNNHHNHVPNRNTSFESNGPDVKLRGNAQQLHEKYMTLAHDAASAGERISAEAYTHLPIIIQTSPGAVGVAETKRQQDQRSDISADATSDNADNRELTAETRQLEE